MKQWIRDAAAQLLWRTGLTSPGRRAAGQLSLVMFHRVLPAAVRAHYPYPTIAVTPEELAWFLELFTTHFECGPVAPLAHRWNAGEFEAAEKPPLAITFDDGQRDNYDFAVPVLHDAGVRASFFPAVAHTDSGDALWHDRFGSAIARILAEPTSPARLTELGIEPAPNGSLSDTVAAAAERAKTLEPCDRAARTEALWALATELGAPDAALPKRDAMLAERDAMMSWDQLAELVSNGHEIGSHTRNHVLLPQCDDAALVHEIKGSREVLQQRLGIDCETFCYPNGNHDDRTVRAVAAAGYRYAVTTQWGCNPPGTDPLRLKRYNMDAAQSADRHGIASPARLAWRISGLHPGLS